MEIRVDRVLCEAIAVCCGLAPQVFELDDDENLMVLIPDTADLAPEQLQRVEKAVERCPKNALSLVDVDG
jgi:ferredoxin